MPAVPQKITITKVKAPGNSISWKQAKNNNSTKRTQETMVTQDSPRGEEQEASNSSLFTV
jgi:hypothetical protein